MWLCFGESCSKVEANKLSHLNNEVKALRTWTETHDKAHVIDDERLNIILETVTGHNANHHGTKSKVKESGLTVILFGVIAALGEVVGLWELFSRIPQPF